jgi:hypothetical protein
VFDPTPSGAHRVIPKSLSASSIQGFEDCPAGWAADWYIKSPSPNNSAAALGSACHEALDYFVGTVDMHDLAAANLLGGPPLQEFRSYLLSLFEDSYWRLFADPERLTEGQDLLSTWLLRQTQDYWTPNRSIIAREQKMNFLLPSSAGDITFNYIFDRLDRIDYEDGTFDIEVVDYKTTAFPLSPMGLKDKPQARCYGVAGRILQPEAAKVWVTFDQLRHEPVGIVFTRDENVATWKYLRRVAERIIATPEPGTLVVNQETGEDEILNPPEMLGNGCRFCIRAATCETLMAHVDAGGILAINDVPTAAKKMSDIDAQIGALNAVRTNLEKFLGEWLAEQEEAEAEVPGFRVYATAKKNRAVDSDMVKRELPDEVAAEYGKIGVTAVDKILKDPRVSTEAKATIKGLVTKNFSSPTVRVSPNNAIDGD